MMKTEMSENVVLAEAQTWENIASDFCQTCNMCEDGTVLDCKCSDEFDSLVKIRGVVPL